MKIAILAWGSLLWNDKQLKLESNWQKSSIKLPLNFSRISDKGQGRLTLVVDQTGTNNYIYYGITQIRDLNMAINALKTREKTVKKFIGYINLINNTFRTANLDKKQLQTIQNWAINNNVDAVIWTDIPANFQEIRGEPFSVKNAMGYINSQKENRKMYNKILEYIFLSKIYGKINTPLSNEVIKNKICNL